MRVNLIQKFLFLNLFWHLAIGLYFGYWFSERLIDSVTRLHSTYLSDELQEGINRYFMIDFFDTPPADPAMGRQRTEQIGTQASQILREKVYPIQILWNRDQAVWSNRENRMGGALADDSLVHQVLDEGKGTAELEISTNKVSWMWNALTNHEAVVNDASSYLRVIIPVRMAQESVRGATSNLVSENLKKHIVETPPGQYVVPGVLELKMDPKPILQRTVRQVESVWKRVGLIYIFSNIVLFGLFKSAFNTIQRQSRELAEQERLSNLGKMASYLAHEIRNPLFIIRGSAQTIEETSEEKSPSRKLSRYVIDEVDRLNNMVQDLLGLVKPRLAPSRKPMSLQNALEESEDRSLKQSPKMTLALQLDKEHDLIWFNRDQFIQVLTNLFRNARDACQGQGTVLVESRSIGSGNLQIRITDDGPGIPQENLDNVFEPFFSGKDNGTGLGLAIVRHLVTGNHATIEVVRAPGAGACFILTVRIAPESALEEDGEPEAEETENA